MTKPINSPTEQSEEANRGHEYAMKNCKIGDVPEYTTILEAYDVGWNDGYVRGHAQGREDEAKSRGHDQVCRIHHGEQCRQEAIPLLKALEFRLKHGCNDTCSKQLSSEYHCTCGQEHALKVLAHFGDEYE